MRFNEVSILLVILSRSPRKLQESNVPRMIAASRKGIDIETRHFLTDGETDKHASPVLKISPA